MNTLIIKPIICPIQHLYHCKFCNLLRTCRTNKYYDKDPRAVPWGLKIYREKLRKVFY